MLVILARRLVERVRKLLKTDDADVLRGRRAGREAESIRHAGSENRDNMRKHNMEKAIG